MVELDAEKLESLVLQLRLLLFKLFLLASEVIVQDDLLLKVVEQLVADLVCVSDSIGDCGVSHLERAHLFLLHNQILR